MCKKKEKKKKEKQKKPFWSFFVVFLSVAWPIGVKMLVFFCSSVPVVLFNIQVVDRNTLFLSSPHLFFILVFICDLFVSRDNPLMS